MSNGFFKKRKALYTSGVIAIIMILIAAAVWYPKSMIYHFKEVQKGVLYRSGALPADDLTRVLKNYKIRTVVNLTGTIPIKKRNWDYKAETAVCKALGVQHININMPEETPPTKDQLRNWLDLFSRPESLPVLVHCNHGVVRTGMLVAAYQMEFPGEDIRSTKETMEALPMFGHDLYKAKRKPMRDFIIGYVSSFDKATPK